MALQTIRPGRVDATNPTASKAARVACQITILGLLVPLAACSALSPTAPTSARTVLATAPAASTSTLDSASTGTLDSNPTSTPLVTVDQVVNVDSSVNDAANPVSIFLEAGTYIVTPIGIEQGGRWDGWNAWGDTTCTEPTGCPVTSPTTVMGWISAYVVTSKDLVAVAVEGRPLPAVTTPRSGRDGEGGIFLKDASSARYYVGGEKAYPDARAALSGIHESTFTIAKSGDVGFSISDDPLRDNLGGMTLHIVSLPASGQ